MQNALSSLLADIMRAKKTAKLTKAYSYLRFSTPEQMAGDSYRRQTELAQRYAEANGLTLDEELTYRDLGVSGYHGANAQSGKLAEFLEAVEKGVVPRGSFLLVESLDRLSRQNPYDALQVSGLDSSLVSARLKELKAEASKTPLDRTALNALLRRLFAGIVIDHTTGELRFRWRHAEEETALTYAPEVSFAE
ncbi:MAG: recombinase family protein [Opitutaceae bacterium]|jgi:hypothetical protein|nr:recombinase family protein [Opitutaceae bacterium]